MDVQKSVQIDNIIKEIVRNLVQIRKQSGSSQYDIAVILKVDRRVIISLENGNTQDFKLICEYCDIMGIELNLTFEIT